MHHQTGSWIINHCLMCGGHFHDMYKIVLEWKIKSNRHIFLGGVIIHLLIIIIHVLSPTHTHTEAQRLCSKTHLWSRINSIPNEEYWVQNKVTLSFFKVIFTCQKHIKYFSHVCYWAKYLTHNLVSQRRLFTKNSS